MVKLDFVDTIELIDFLNDTKDFNEWETITFRLSTAHGIELNVNTHVSDPLKSRRFIEFKKLKLMLENFIKENAHLSVNLEIKLKFPDELKNNLDQLNDYEYLYLTFYSDQISSFAITSFLENSAQLNSAPIRGWSIYIMNLYTSWRQKRGI